MGEGRFEDMKLYDMVKLKYLKNNYEYAGI